MPSPLASAFILGGAVVVYGGAAGAGIALAVAGIVVQLVVFLLAATGE